MTIEGKISAITKLMTDGVLTADEFAKIVSLLNGIAVEAPAREKTPAELTYEKYITENVAKMFKSPGSIKYPPFNPSMVKEGTIKLDFKEQNVKYIETYVDAPNAYGTMLREEIIIGIDDDFHPLFWAQHVQICALLGNSNGWIKMSK